VAWQKMHTPPSKCVIMSIYIYSIVFPSSKYTWRASMLHRMRTTANLYWPLPKTITWRDCYLFYVGFATDNHVQALPRQCLHVTFMYVHSNKYSKGLLPPPPSATKSLSVTLGYLAFIIANNKHSNWYLFCNSVRYNIRTKIIQLY
jgi:hypothetical protein